MNEKVMDKMWRGCNFFLYRILRTKKPCLRRTLVMYRWCCRHGVNAHAVVGVYREDKSLKGHSWLLVDGIPYRENEEELKKYTPMLEG
jgi:hypothetical protein